MHIRPQVVGAVHSPDALARALRLRPGDVDFLEIRVDAFALDPLPILRVLSRLRAPLIITVRHPAEGGANRLTTAHRRALFAQFLPFASSVDIELRSATQLATTVADARACGVRVIISDHHFRTMPSTARLRQTIHRAHAAGADICKIAALAETPAALAQLLALFTPTPALPLSIMGMGHFGKISRLLLAQAGSVLNYGYLDAPNASGQWEAVLLKKRLAELDEPAS
ncbi:MAG: type I 3-dehydroquinate dehydratase [Chthoniobacter sp.]|nr:type I 3-dehydroquinate dehydratase [Chthoniobacter sp.]